jgi:hypothetical protein
MSAGRGGGPPAPERPLRLGVLGTLVWDRIVDRDGRNRPVEEWGGISYALESLCVSLPSGWVLKPLLKVGEDLAQQALTYLHSIPRLDVHPGVLVVPFPNHRVELQYRGQERTRERLVGGVTPWSWGELEPLLRQIDALYLNFITGFEMGVETAQHFRKSFPGPLYADLHSLFLGISSQGDRFPRQLPEWKSWMGAFDAVQMNEEEFELLGRSRGDPWQLAAEVVGKGPNLISVTMGARGAAYMIGPEFSPAPASWAGTRASPGAGVATQRGRVEPSGGLSSGDPTGCGDVWGATFFGRLLAGNSLETAMAQANRLAARKLGHRGARGLHLHLDGA